MMHHFLGQDGSGWGILTSAWPLFWGNGVTSQSTHLTSGLKKEPPQFHYSLLTTLSTKPGPDHFDHTAARIMEEN